MNRFSKGGVALFGYVKPVVKELLVKEHEFYRATYCGICRSMQKHTGFLSNVTITYDSVFLALVRMAYMDDSEMAVGAHRCAIHPLRAKPMMEDNPALEYTADAFAVLTYYKMMDDLSDESFGKRLGVSLIRPLLASAKRQARQYRLEEIAKFKLSQISELEKAKCPSVDEPAHLFGELLGEIFAGELEGEDRLVTYQCGYHLGKFIYVADAIEDYYEDRRKGRYNPFVISYGGEDLTEDNRSTVKCALLLECRALEGAVNLIPFKKKITAENIVRNIIYLGLTERISFLDKEDDFKRKEIAQTK